jgi:phage/plasmid-like protein (TIGR03299 family)
MDTDAYVWYGKEPWHGLGRELPAAADSEYLRNEVFCWDAVERPVSYQGEFDDVGTTEYKALVRSDTQALLSIQKSSYGVVQYHEALALLDAAAGNEARYISAGTLFDGRRAFVLADVPSATFDVAGHEMKPYLLLSTSHDGSRAIRCLFTPVYVVCNNTETAALLEAGVQAGGKARRKYLPNVLTIAHTKNALQRIEIAAKLIDNARRYFGAFHERALRLVNQRFTTFDMDVLATMLFADRSKVNGGFTPGTIEARKKVVALFNGGQRANVAPGTAWGAYNAVTEYVDHWTERRSKSSRFEAITSGTGASLRQTALDYLSAKAA